VRSNCIAPAARTRLTEATPGLGEVIQPPKDGFDVWDPANVSPLVAYLATAGCPFNGQTFFVQGGAVKLMQPWKISDGIERDSRWTVDELAEQLLPFA
jgi:NAD(P)-dependent dehydrogenase (short-subunit alcohol dehydrogenase family)